MKRILVLLSLLFIVTNILAQSKFGLDENKCKENLSMFREYYKQKNYIDALRPWRWTFNNCPGASGNIYKNGPKIIKEIMKQAQDNKSAYIDTMMMIFDKRIEYGFGEEGYILGLKGYELLLADKNRSLEAFSILEEAITLSGNKSDFRSVYGYMKAIVNLEKSGERKKEDVLRVYAIVSDVVNYNIVNETNVSKYFIQYSEKIENLFAPYANCNDLIKIFSSKFDPLTEDIVFLKRITNILEQKDCVDSELFFEASARLYQLEPSASSAYKMSQMSISKGNSSEAVVFAKTAIEIEKDPGIQAKYYLGLADAFRSSGSYSLARNAVYSSLEIRGGWGEAYMSLGNIYLSGLKDCGDSFEQQTVYWIAVDAFKKALLDENTQIRASKSINTYSKYFPDTETCFFNGVESGKTHTVGCWINKKTIVRTSD